MPTQTARVIAFIDIKNGTPRIVFKGASDNLAADKLLVSETIKVLASRSNAFPAITSVK